MEKFNSTLLIDDDSITNHLSKRLLEKFSIANGIYTVENGEEALKFIVNYDPDFNTCPELIFLDLNMPVMDGLTFLDIYQGLTYLNKDKVVIVMLTNSQDEKVINKCREYGVKYFLNKPLTEQKLNQLFEEIALAASHREQVNLK
ncbi:MAG TPA: response regulator [Cytophagaceae bacterium]